jgi:ketosteroid isomerase-like protein
MGRLLAPAAWLTWVVAGVYSPALHAFPNGTRWDRAGIVRNQVAFIGRFRSGFSQRVISMTGEGSWVAAEVIGDGRRADTGRRYLQHSSIHWHIRRGRILEIRMYEDTLLDWDVWENSGPAVTAAPPAAATAGEDRGGSGAGPASADDPERNKAVVRRFLMAVPLRSAELIREAWAPDGVWSFPTGGDYLPAARRFAGAPHWGRDATIGMLQNGQNGLKEPLTLDVYSMIAQGDRVCAEAIGVMVRPDGASYRQHYSFHFTLRGGRIVEGHPYGDTLHGYDLKRRP